MVVTDGARNNQKYLFVFRFFLSVFFSNSKVAAACAGIIYFITYIPYMYIAVGEEKVGHVVPTWTKAVAVSERLNRYNTTTGSY